jgi:nucleotide-binding universal stress UspA family protein
VELALQTIVAATDFSEVGDRAVDAAFRLAADHGARLLLLHVVERPPTPNPLYAHYVPMPGPEETRRAVAAVEAALRERVPAQLRTRVPHEAIARLGDPAEEILRLADERSASLVVVASHDRGPVARALLGSVSGRVAARARCPVLIAR